MRWERVKIEKKENRQNSQENKQAWEIAVSSENVPHFRSIFTILDSLPLSLNQDMILILSEFLFLHTYNSINMVSTDEVEEWIENLHDCNVFVVHFMNRLFFYQILSVFCFRKRLKISRQSTPSDTQKRTSIATTMMLWKDMRLSMT